MSRTIRRRALALSFAAALALAACSRSGAPPAGQTDQAKPAPAQPAGDQPVNADAKALAGFIERVNQYMALHEKLEGSLPKLSKDATPKEIDKFQRALATLIQENRKGAKVGDVFMPEAQAVIKRLLVRVFGGPDGPALRASIMDEGPAALKITINGRYPDEVPLSTVPPQVLEGLPKLPEELEYRFIGSRLILMDVEAHIILDVIENALPS